MKKVSLNIYGTRYLICFNKSRYHYFS